MENFIGDGNTGKVENFEKGTENPFSFNDVMAGTDYSRRSDTSYGANTFDVDKHFGKLEIVDDSKGSGAENAKSSNAERAANGDSGTGTGSDSFQQPASDGPQKPKQPEETPPDDKNGNVSPEFKNNKPEKNPELPESDAPDSSSGKDLNSPVALDKGGEQPIGDPDMGPRKIYRDDKDRVGTENGTVGSRSFEYEGDSGTLKGVTFQNGDNTQVFTRDAKGNMVSTTPDGKKNVYSDITVNQQNGDVTMTELNGQRVTQGVDGKVQRYDAYGRPTYARDPETGEVTEWDINRNEKTVTNEKTGERTVSRIPDKEAYGDPIMRSASSEEEHPSSGEPHPPLPGPPKY